ncbi:glycosyltransferase [Flavobacterium sp. N3904]|uniref:glycosyltransferase n=1 Tax=Flavobacterium sp. N3904 TaxID=2986835 RepID=UPI002225A483|nr:glycosyltransferase [Flavobacterium sp. N3904]
MRILMVSIPSLHFFRWTSQLQDSGHEVYWFDITGMSEPVERLSWVSQKTAWKLRFNYPGRIFFKKNFSKVYRFLQGFNEQDTATVFEEYLKEVKPDVVHSFALYLSCTPILGVMNKYQTLKWIYSSWGSDLYYFQNELSYLKDIKNVLFRIDYLFTDCKRDYEIAKKHGFKGEFLGVFPGGGGFLLEKMKVYSIPFEQRKTILIKGFQGRSGRAIPVLKAIEEMKKLLQEYEIVVFGADKEVIAYTDNSVLQSWDNFAIYGKSSHEEILKLMGKSLIYIGNSNSDGIANTLLEAICMGVFPIQSNPGGVSEEIITNGINGLLIEDCEDVLEIIEKIKYVITIDLKPAVAFNSKNLSLIFEYNYIKEKVEEKYNNLMGNLSS